jgi:hypothetical protein
MDVRYVRSKQIVESKIADEVVMLDMDSGFYFGLNSVASDIWTMLENPISVGEIVVSLLAQYEVDQATCNAETKEIIEEMLKHRLVQILK